MQHWSNHKISNLVMYVSKCLRVFLQMGVRVQLCQISDCTSHCSIIVQAFFSHYSDFKHYSAIIQSLFQIKTPIEIRYRCLAFWCALCTLLFE